MSYSFSWCLLDIKILNKNTIPQYDTFPDFFISAQVEYSEAYCSSIKCYSLMSSTAHVNPPSVEDSTDKPLRLSKGLSLGLQGDVMGL